MKKSIVFIILFVAGLSVATCNNSTKISDNDMRATQNKTHIKAESGSATATASGKLIPPVNKNGFNGMPAPGTKAFCPVMKNDFKVTANSTYSIYKGKTYVFCCPGCKPTFEANPEKYVN